jgi:hypothetical protein
MAKPKKEQPKNTITREIVDLPETCFTLPQDEVRKLRKVRVAARESQENPTPYKLGTPRKYPCKKSKVLITKKTDLDDPAIGLALCEAIEQGLSEAINEGKEFGMFPPPTLVQYHFPNIK